MIALLPTPTGRPPIRVMLVTEGVHSCHRSTSLMTCHTRSAGAAMSTVMLKFLNSAPQSGRG
jgi:hypothetical protein